MKKVGAFLFLVHFMLHAENLKFENVRVGGEGCRPDLTQVITTEDQSALSLLFSNFEVRVPNTQGGLKANRNISKLTCNLFFEVSVPAGQSLQNVDVSFDMRGFVQLDIGVQAQFQSYLMSASGLGVETRVARGPQLLTDRYWLNSFSDQTEDFTISGLKSIDTMSNCSRGVEKVMVNLQHHVIVQIQIPYQNTSAAGVMNIDTSDVTGGMKIKTRTRACSSSGSNGRVEDRVERRGDRSTPRRLPRNCKIIETPWERRVQCF